MAEIHAHVASKIASDPSGAATSMALMAAAIVVLAWAVYHYRAKAAKASSFQAWQPGMHSHWYHGSADAGNGGPVDRAPTAWNEAPIHSGANMRLETVSGSCGSGLAPEATIEASALHTLGALNAPGEVPSASAARYAEAGKRGVAANLSDDHLVNVLANAGTNVAV